MLCGWEDNRRSGVTLAVTNLVIRVIGHLYSAILWDKHIAKALRYVP